MSVGGAVSSVPFIPEVRIERDADALIAEYVSRSGTAVSAPVPIEDILELHLGLSFAVEDLAELFGTTGVLGAIWFDRKEIRIDSQLDPTSNASQLGRYRFTVAHEIGHWRLHRPYYITDPAQATLFNGRGQPAFVCRASSKNSEEWQADTFASFLLMPKKLLTEAWQAWRGNLDAVVLDDLPLVRAFPGRSEDGARMESFVKPLATQFEVSAEAMRIRLEKLGLLERKREPKLF